MNELHIGAFVYYNRGNSVQPGEIIGMRTTTDIISGSKGIGVWTDTKYMVRGDNDVTDFMQGEMITDAIRRKLETIRKALNKENISTQELVDLEKLADFIEDGDVQLLEAADVLEDVR